MAKKNVNIVAAIAAVTLADVERTWGNRRKQMAEIRENIRSYALTAYRLVSDGAFRLALVKATGKARLVDRRSGKVKEIPSMNEVDIICFDGIEGGGQSAIMRELQRLAPAVACEVDPKRGYSVLDLFQTPHNGRYLTLSQLGTIGKKSKSRKDAEKMAYTMTAKKPRGAKKRTAGKDLSPWQVIKHDLADIRKVLPKLSIQHLAKLTDELTELMDKVNAVRPTATEATTEAA